MLISQEVSKRYRDACLSAYFNGHGQPLEQFKKELPNEFRYLQKYFRIRTELNKDIQTMKDLNYKVYWCTLSFDNEHYKNDEELMRKSAFRFLNDIFTMFVAVEEHGEDNNRYHIHLFGAFRHDKTFNDFFAWHSRTDIECLTKKLEKTKTRYLTNYCVKSCPRLRRNKKLVAARKERNKLKTWNHLGFNFYEEQYKKNITNIFDDDLPF